MTTNALDTAFAALGALPQRSPGLSHTSKGQDPQAWQREMERAQLDTWLSHGVLPEGHGAAPTAGASPPDRFGSKDRDTAEEAMLTEANNRGALVMADPSLRMHGWTTAPNAPEPAPHPSGSTLPPLAMNGQGMGDDLATEVRGGHPDASPSQKGIVLAGGVARTTTQLQTYGPARLDSVLEAGASLPAGTTAAVGAPGAQTPMASPPPSGTARNAGPDSHAGESRTVLRPTSRGAPAAVSEPVRIHAQWREAGQKYDAVATDQMRQIKDALPPSASRELGAWAFPDLPTGIPSSAIAPKAPAPAPQTHGPTSSPLAKNWRGMGHEPAMQAYGGQRDLSPAPKEIEDAGRAERLTTQLQAYGPVRLELVSIQEARTSVPAAPTGAVAAPGAQRPMPTASLNAARPTETERHCGDSRPALRPTLRGAPTAVNEPIRIHAQWSEAGLRLWLGLDAEVLAQARQITDELQRWVAREGVRLLSLSCNGRPLVDSDAIAEGAEWNEPAGPVTYNEGRIARPGRT